MVVVSSALGSLIIRERGSLLNWTTMRELKLRKKTNKKAIFYRVSVFGGDKFG